MAKPTLVIVTGPPRSGTREVAQALGEQMPCPVICRDEIKEGMVHAYGTAFEPAAGDDLNQPALRVFFEALRLMVMGGGRSRLPGQVVEIGTRTTCRARAIAHRPVPR